MQMTALVFRYAYLYGIRPGVIRISCCISLRLRYRIRMVPGLFVRNRNKLIFSSTFYRNRLKDSISFTQREAECLIRVINAIDCLESAKCYRCTVRLIGIGEIRSTAILIQACYSCLQLSASVICNLNCNVINCCVCCNAVLLCCLLTDRIGILSCRSIGNRFERDCSVLTVLYCLKNISLTVFQIKAELSVYQIFTCQTLGSTEGYACFFRLIIVGKVKPIIGICRIAILVLYICRSGYRCNKPALFVVFYADVYLVLRFVIFYTFGASFLLSHNISMIPLRRIFQLLEAKVAFSSHCLRINRI